SRPEGGLSGCGCGCARRPPEGPCRPVRQALSDRPLAGAAHGGPGAARAPCLPRCRPPPRPRAAPSCAGRASPRAPSRTAPRAPPRGPPAAPPERMQTPAAARSEGAGRGSRPARSCLPHLLALLFQLVLELPDGAVDQHLGGAIRTAERTCDLAVVHPEREAHDQCLTSVLGQRTHNLQYC